MSIKVYKPTGNARRDMSVTDYSELSKVAPERSLLVSLIQLWKKADYCIISSCWTSGQFFRP